MSRRLLSSNKYPYYSRQRFGSWSFRGEDRISDLPNDVLCRILSFLPSTKSVVRTSILSKFWKKIWASVPNLCFRDEEFLSSDDFIAFVDRVLLLRVSSAINKFHLHFNSCPPEDLCRVDHWISVAARCNVVELVLAVSSSDRKQVFKLPVSLATCRTVEVLRLMSLFIIDNLPPRTSFTRLKCLHIHFTAVNGEYTSIEGFDFSVLEHFIIDGDPERHLMDLEISAPRLKTMTIEFSSSHCNHKYYNIDINAPNLEKLEIKEGTLSNFILENTKSLVEANIEIILHHIEEEHVPMSSVRRATEFLAALSAVKYLSLSWCFYECCSVPAFNNLIQLKLVHYGCSHWWKNLMQLLERSPNLQFLFIDNGNYPKRKQLEVVEIDEEEDEVIEHTGSEAPMISDITNYTSVQTWSPPNTIPNCLLSHLKTIAIRGFIGKDCIGYLEEMEVTKYLLKNGRVLEQMTIYTPGLFRETKKDIWKETGMILWGSKFVCVEVIQKMIDV